MSKNKNGNFNNNILFNNNHDPGHFATYVYG